MALTSASISAGGSINQDQSVKGSEWLTIIGQVGSAGTPATAAGDANPFVKFFLEDGTTVLAGSGTAMPTDDTTTASLTNGVAVKVSRYRLKGIAKVRISLQNNNVAALPGQLDYFIG